MEVKKDCGKVDMRVQFDLKYYSWALSDGIREIDEGYPFLSTFPRGIGYHCLKSLQMLSESDQRKTLSLLIKRFHVKSLKTIGEELSEEEKMSVERFVRQVLNNVAESDYQLPSFGRSHGAASTINSKMVAIYLKNELKKNPELEMYKKLHALQWAYLTDIGEWQLETFIDVTGKDNEFFYTQKILNRKDPLPLKQGIALLSWLGMCGQTGWKLQSMEELEEIVTPLRTLIRHFIIQAGKLLPDSSV